MGNGLDHVAPEHVRTQRASEFRWRSAWIWALVTPAVVGPVWCFGLAGRLPGVIGTMAGVVLLLLLVTCSCTDLQRHKIPNWATYTALFWVVAINCCASSLEARQMASDAQVAARTHIGPGFLGAVGIQQSALGGLVCFLVMLVAYNLAHGGAGDVKLATVIGAALGVKQGLLAVACSYVAAGVAILAWTIWSLGPLYLAAALGRKIGAFLLPLWVRPPTDEERELLAKPVPLAPFFAVGTILVMLEVFTP